MLLPTKPLVASSFACMLLLLGMPAAWAQAPDAQLQPEPCDPDALTDRVVELAGSTTPQRAYPVLAELLSCESTDVEAHLMSRRLQVALALSKKPSTCRRTNGACGEESSENPEQHPQGSEDDDEDACVPWGLLLVTVANAGREYGTEPTETMQERLETYPYLHVRRVENKRPHPRSAVWFRPGLEPFAMALAEQMGLEDAPFREIDWNTRDDIIFIWGDPAAMLTPKVSPMGVPMTLPDEPEME